MHVENDPDYDVECVARYGLYTLLQLCWHLFESKPFRPSWHIEEQCLHLEALYEGVFDELVICMPPGTGKSNVTSVVFPVWVWILDPGYRLITSSFDPSLAVGFAKKSRAIIESPWFARRWPHVRVAAASSSDKAALSDSGQEYHTTAGGWRFSTSVKGKATGRHPDLSLCDDPVKPYDVGDTPDPVALAHANKWWSQTMGSRARNPRELRRLMQMQRLHENDPAGKCLRDGYTGLVLPMEFDPETACRTPVGGDRRTRPGEPITDDYDRDTLAKIESRLGSAAYRVQYNQDATPKKGGILDTERFRTYIVPPQDGTIVSSWDCRNSGQDKHSRVHGAIWQLGRDEHGHIAYFWLAEWIGWWTFSETVREFGSMLDVWGDRVTMHLVENKAEGPALVDHWRATIDNVQLITPRQDKVRRAKAISPIVDSGAVYVSSTQSWVTAAKEELQSFPLGRYNDRVDTTTQAIRWLRDNGDPDEVHTGATGYGHLVQLFSM